MAERAGEDATAVEGEMRAFVSRARAAWEGVEADAPPFVRAAVNAHLERVALK
jgi:hypothetical protein